MKFIKQLVLILAVSFFGEILNRVIPLPIPAGVYGIVILFLLLTTKIVPLEAVEKTGDFLIEIMPLMFIPAAVELITTWDAIKGSVVAYLVITAISTVAVMGVSGVVTQLIMKYGRNKK